MEQLSKPIKSNASVTSVHGSGEDLLITFTDTWNINTRPNASATMEENTCKSNAPVTSVHGNCSSHSLIFETIIEDQILCHQWKTYNQMKPNAYVTSVHGNEEDLLMIFIDISTTMEDQIPLPLWKNGTHQ